MANEQANLIWIDCEMTGLSLEKDVLVEIAVRPGHRLRIKRDR